ncbi:glutamine-rich protein 2 [Pleurodeles waltl]|uniref:glutamine-rich protein 2 n=1 Tax=Pleurodeles waltl TaxID=8319 RepID=UPI003709A462
MPSKVSLFDLTNLSIGTPEVGAVNFNALHTLLHAILRQLNIQDVQAEISDEDRKPATGVPSKSAPPLPATEASSPKAASVYHELEKKVQEIEQQMEVLNNLPTGTELMERSKATVPTAATPVGDMWQMMQMKKKIETNEDGVTKKESMSQRKSGFKPCNECGAKMSVTDPHTDCLWCLSSDHDVDKCDSCQRMNPKALKEREAKLFLAKSKKKEKQHRRNSSSPKSHRRHRDSRRRRESRSSRERSRLRSPSARRRKTWEVSPTISPQPQTPLASPASPASLMSPLNPPSVFEVPQHQEFSLASQTPGPAPMSPQAQAPQYPALPDPGADSSAFLNAMFAIFQQMAPGGGPAGPSGPLAFNMGAPAPLRPAPFMPFLPMGGVDSAPVPMASTSQPVTPSRFAGPAPERSPVHPLPHTATKKSTTLMDPTSDGSEDRRQASMSADALSTARIEARLESRRLALRLLEEQEYQKQALEEGEIEEPLGDPQGLDTACGLDTSPEWDLTSPGEYTEEAASFHSVIKKAADFFNLPLPVSEPKPNILTEVLHPASTVAEPLLPFNEALLDPILEIWKKPVSSSAVNRSVACRYQVALADPGFLSRHPTPESLVVQASCSSRTAPGSFPGVPSDRDSKKMDQSSKKAFSSCSMALKSTNATCILGRYIYALMDEIKSSHTEVPQEVLSLVTDAQAAATQNMALLQDLLNEMNVLKSDVEKLNEQFGEAHQQKMQEDVDTVHQSIKDMEERLKQFPGPEEMKKMVEWEVLHEALVKGRTDSPTSQTSVQGVQFATGATSGIPGPAPGSQAQAPGTQAQAPGTQAQAPGTQAQAPGTPGHAPGTPGHAPGTPGHAPGIPGSAPGTPGTAPGTQAHAPGTPDAAPGTPGPAPGTIGPASGTQAHAPGTPGAAPGAPGAAPGTQQTLPTAGADPARHSEHTSAPDHASPTGIEHGHSPAETARSDTSLSRTSSVSERYNDTVEALRNLGGLSDQNALLKQLIDALEQKKADRSEVKQIKQITDMAKEKLSKLPDDLDKRLATFEKNLEETHEDRQKLQRLEKVLDPMAGGTGPKLEGDTQMGLQLAFLSSTVQDIEKELKELRNKQDQGKAKMEQSVAQTSVHLQDQLDKLRSILQSMVSSSSTLLSMSMQQADGRPLSALDAAETASVTSRSESLPSGHSPTPDMPGAVRAPSSKVSSVQAQGTCPACSIDVSEQVSQLVSKYEKLQDLVNSFMARQSDLKSVRKTSLRCQMESAAGTAAWRSADEEGHRVRRNPCESPPAAPHQSTWKASEAEESAVRVVPDAAVINHKEAELLNRIQSTIHQLQEECEKLNATTGNLIEDHQQKQRHIDIIYQSLEKLEEKKADKDHLEMDLDVKADKRALEGKVSRTQFDATNEQLNRMMHELLDKVTVQEQDWQKVVDKISSEMESKLDRLELDPFKRQLEERWKAIRKQLKDRSPSYEADEAAGIRKQLIARFHCISCDRPVDMMVPGPQVMTVPSMPGLPCHRSNRPYTVYELDQVRQHLCSERMPEMSDYGFMATPRSCGGSHTLTFPHRRYTRLQNINSNQCVQPEEENILALLKQEEVDILGLDGHIYRGRMENRFPAIPVKDASKIRGKSSQSSIKTDANNVPERPRSAKSSSSTHALSRPLKDRPVSSQGRLSQTSLVPPPTTTPLPVEPKEELPPPPPPQARESLEVRMDVSLKNLAEEEGEAS